MRKITIFRGLEIMTLMALLALTACGGSGGGGTDSSGTTTLTTTSGGGGGGGSTATATYVLSWSAVSGSSVTGYRVYYGTAPLSSKSPLGTVDTNLTSLEFSPGQYKIAAGTTLYMAVSTLGANGVESPISNTASVVVQ
jgi:hypothetical protein